MVGGSPFEQGASVRIEKTLKMVGLLKRDTSLESVIVQVDPKQKTSPFKPMINSPQGPTLRKQEQSLVRLGSVSPLRKTPKVEKIVQNGLTATGSHVFSKRELELALIKQAQEKLLIEQVDKALKVASLKKGGHTVSKRELEPRVHELVAQLESYRKGV